MLITTRPSRYLDDRMVGPVVAFNSNGFRQAEADAVSIAGCLAVRINYKSANCSIEIASSLLATTTALGLFMNDREMPFIPFGKEHRFAQEAARLAGFTEQSAMLQLRLRQWQYLSAPAGALVPDLTSPLPLAEKVLLGIEEGQIDVPLFKLKWARQQLIKWQQQGVEFPDRLGDPNFLN